MRKALVAETAVVMVAAAVVVTVAVAVALQVLATPAVAAAAKAVVVAVPVPPERLPWAGQRGLHLPVQQRLDRSSALLSWELSSKGCLASRSISR